jgi:hypothetical protein
MATLDLLDELFARTPAGDRSLRANPSITRSFGASQNVESKNTSTIGVPNLSTNGSVARPASSYGGGQPGPSPQRGAGAATPQSATLSRQKSSTADAAAVASPSPSRTERFPDGPDGDADTLWSMVRTGRVHEAHALSRRRELLNEAEWHGGNLAKHRIVDEELEAAIDSRDAMLRCKREAGLRDVLMAFAREYPHVTVSPFLDAGRTRRRRRLLRQIVERHENGVSPTVTPNTSTLAEAAHAIDTWCVRHSRSPCEALLLACLLELARGLVQLCTSVVATRVASAAALSLAATPVSSPSKTVVLSAASPRPSPGTSLSMTQAVTNWRAMMARDAARSRQTLERLVTLLAIARAVNTHRSPIEVKASASLIVGESHALVDAILTAIASSPLTSSDESLAIVADVRKTMQAAVKAASTRPQPGGMCCCLTGMNVLPTALAGEGSLGATDIAAAVAVRSGTGEARHWPGPSAEWLPVSGVALAVWRRHVSIGSPAVLAAGSGDETAPKDTSPRAAFPTAEELSAASEV